MSLRIILHAFRIEGHILVVKVTQGKKKSLRLKLFSLDNNYKIVMKF